MNTRAILPLVGLVLFSGSALGQNFVKPWATLPMDAPKDVRYALPLGNKALTDTLHLSIGIACRDTAGLQAFADSVSNPKSSSYGKFITPEEVGRRFGISDSNLKRIVDYLSSQGIKIRLSCKNRLSILADATVAQVQSAFNTSIEEYLVRTSPGLVGDVRYAFTNPPSVPSALAPFVRMIGGLENVRRPKPMATLTPSQLQTLYAVTPLLNNGYQGQGRTVAISNWDGYRLSNIPLMVQQWNLPLPPAGAGSNVTVVSIDGQNGNISSYQGEGDIDIQCALGMAPLCNLMIYDNANQSDYVGVLSQEADDNLADIVTESYGWTEDEPTFEQTHAIHLSMTAQGITYMSASGDSGADGVPNYPYPDDEPENLVVGGTSVTTDGLGNRESEVVWNNSIGAGGGGWSVTSDSFNVLPSWQRGNGVPTTIPYRLSPDISLDADPDTGYDIFMGGQLEEGWGGTSCASPTFAGSLAAAEQELIANNALPKDAAGKQRMGRIQDLLYSFNGDPTVFYDVTSGTNGTLPNGMASNAGVGWDTASGWGAPILNGLVDKILGIPIPTSFSITPGSVLGGVSATGTLTINVRAPAAGLTFSLSADTSDVSIPSAVTIPQGATSATFTIGTFGTGSTETANFTATAAGVTLTASLTLTPTALTSVSVAPASIVGGNQSLGTVTLNGAATVGGDDIALTSSNPIVSVPEHVEIAAGNQSDMFSINTSAVTSATTVTITATYGGVSVNTTVTVTPGALAGFTVTPAAIPGGASAIGTLTMNGSAPAGGMVVSLSSNNAAASVPATATIPAGASSVTVTVSAQSVSSNTAVTLTATQGGTSFTAQITVTIAGLGGVNVSPSQVVGGNSSLGTVSLTGVAVASPVTVTLSSNNGNVSVPTSVVVPKGASSATFSVSTKPVSSPVAATITASQGSNTQTTSLSVTPATMTGLSISPNSVEGGSSASGTVTLSGPAPSGGSSILLNSSSSNLITPASVLVPSGSTSVSFTVSTTAVSTDTPATITASFGGMTQSATVTVLSPLLAAVSVSPNSVIGGNTTSGVITLNRAAPSGGVSVTLVASGGMASLPSNVPVSGGATTASFNISTTGVATASTETVTASLGGTSKAASFGVLPATLIGFTLSPSTAVGGDPSTGNVMLNGQAPAGGTRISLSSSSLEATVQPTVTIASGSTNSSFAVTTKSVNKPTTATLTAKSGSVSIPVQLTLEPAGLASVSLSMPNVIGGSTQAVTGTITFNGPAPTAGDLVKLSSSAPSVASVQPSVRLTGGKLGVIFVVTHHRVNASTPVTITATYNGVTEKAELQVLPFQIMSFVISPNPVIGGKSAIGTVLLNATPGSGAGAISIKMSSSAKAVSAPLSVTAPTGRSSAKVTLTTSKVTSAQTASVTASIVGSTTSTSLTVNP